MGDAEKEAQLRAELEGLKEQLKKKSRSEPKHHPSQGLRGSCFRCEHSTQTEENFEGASRQDLCHAMGT